MLDLNVIRSEPEQVATGLGRRGGGHTLDTILKIDENRRALITESDELRNRRNVVSKEVGRLKASGGDATAQMAESKTIGERIKQIEGKPSAFRHYAEARRLLAISEKGGSDELLRQALSQLTLAEQLSPRWEAISVLAGTIHEKLGQSNAAIDAYLEAIELGDDNPALVRRVAQLLIRANRLQEADRMFRQLAERQQVLSGDLERQISWVKTRMGDFDAAIDPARKTAAATNKTEDLVWLGQLLGIVGRRMQSEGQDEEARVLFDEGEQALRRAVVQKMDAPEPWIALIQFYGQTGQKEKARQTINRARLTLTTTAAATVLGQCYEVLDELDKAAEQYEIAVQANPKDPKIALQAAAFLARAKRIDEAKSHYLRVIQGKVDAEAPMKAEARRGMASLLSEQGGIENRRLAIEWLDRNLAETPDSVADQVLKAAILASLAFHTRVPVEAVHREGITGITPEDIAYADELGYSVKLLAIGKKHGKTVEARVHPTMILKTHPLASVRGSFNAIYLHGNIVDDIMLYGRGAGDMPTASAVVSDVVYAAGRGRHRYTTFYNEDQVSDELSFENNWESEFFLRFIVKDAPGVLAKIASVLGQHQVSVATVMQKGRRGEHVPLIFVTHKAKEISVKRAVDDISYIPEVISVASMIRVES